MTVSLSSFAGAGWQFFDNNGDILSGGKIYTYSAGTTALATTYTDSTGSTANTNPIILDSAGRVPYEIWLTSGFQYKFILKNSSDVQISSWDNIPSIASSQSSSPYPYNGTISFAPSNVQSGYGVIFAPQMVRLNADRIKPNNTTTLEAIFDSANDSLTLAANTLYYFKGVLYFTKTASSTSSIITLGFIFTNTQQDIAYGIGSSISAAGTGNFTRSIIAGSTNTSLSLTTTTTTQTIFIEGFFKSNATTGGTVTPAFAQSVVGTTTAPSALAGSFIMIQPMSSDINATLLAGNWA